MFYGISHNSTYTKFGKHTKSRKKTSGNTQCMLITRSAKTVKKNAAPQQPHNNNRSASFSASASPASMAIIAMENSPAVPAP